MVASHRYLRHGKLESLPRHGALFRRSFTPVPVADPRRARNARQRHRSLPGADGAPVDAVFRLRPELHRAAANPQGAAGRPVHRADVRWPVAAQRRRRRALSLQPGRSFGARHRRADGGLRYPAGGQPRAPGRAADRRQLSGRGTGNRRWRLAAAGAAEGRRRELYPVVPLRRHHRPVRAPLPESIPRRPRTPARREPDPGPAGGAGRLPGRRGPSSRAHPTRPARPGP